VPEVNNYIILRGIDVVRNKIKMFAQQKVTLPKGRQKIIILDEADRLVKYYLIV
jgi:replication factor C subunit 2/4